MGWALAWAVGLSVVYGLFENTNGHPISTEVAALYNSMDRIAWGAAVCWVIFACATGYGGETLPVFILSSSQIPKDFMPAFASNRSEGRSSL